MEYSASAAALMCCNNAFRLIDPVNGSLHGSGEEQLWYFHLSGLKTKLSECPMRCGCWWLAMFSNPSDATL